MKTSKNKCILLFLLASELSSNVFKLLMGIISQMTLLPKIFGTGYEY